MFKPFDSVLIANRGEIAVRVIRAAHDAGLRAIAIYADSDANAPHVALADDAYPLHGDTAAETYLDARKVIDVALTCQAQAIHPGYGFLSENATFAQQVIDSGLVWIGPRPDTIRVLGDKVTAREIAEKAGVPLLPGTRSAVGSAAEIEEFARLNGMPIAIKAAHGGGGRGMRVVRDIDSIGHAFDSATRESVAAFGRAECFVERYLDKPRHVEAQVLADRYGSVIVVGTRDCSLQRRHQKLVEEAPAPFLSTEQEAAIRTAAKAICHESEYVGAGTVEFLVGAHGAVFFLEVNTRLQVEHPVTEETTGIDLVKEQFRIAGGERLSISQDPPAVGHAFEFRINCEDPFRGFIPNSGTIEELSLPQGPGVRVDSGVDAGTVIGGQFDSLLAKLVVTGPDRASALARSRRALAELNVRGVQTVLPFHRAIAAAPAFTASDGNFDVHTTWIESEGIGLLESLDDDAGGGLRVSAPEPDASVVSIRIGTRVHKVSLPGLAQMGPRAEAIREQSAQAAPAGAANVVNGDEVAAPMQGTITKIAVAEGQMVVTGDLIAVVEAMKMENPVRAHKAGRIDELGVGEGDTRAGGQLICFIRSVD